MFVTGTDTGVGKTTVAAALLAAAVRRGETVFGYKPVESGCLSNQEGERVAADASLLGRAAGHDAICSFRYEAPLAPEAAAAESGEPYPSLETIERAYRALKKRGTVLVEGAGGWLVPLAPKLLIADLAIALGLPVLVVARDGLGTINHTCLTLNAIARRGLKTVGFVFSATLDVGPERAHANARAIFRETGAPYLGQLPWLVDRQDTADLARAANTLHSSLN